jgi:uncharacterized membrane protein YhaH (DUF805 family)
MDKAQFRFLFQDSEGTVPAPVWRRWTLVLTGVGVAMAAIWTLVSPWTQRDLATQSLFDLKAFLAFVYLLVFSLGLLLTQVSQYNLSAKRLRAKGFSPGWAAAWPLAAFLTGASFWAQPNFFGLLPGFAPWLLLFASTAGFAAQFFELGVKPD